MHHTAFIDMLRNRVSCGQLGMPEPSTEQLNLLFQAAFRAADHHSLKPWRFLVIQGDGLDALGKLFVSAQEAVAGELLPEQRNRALSLPRRAPLIVVAIASFREDPKVPEDEQLLSAGAAVQNMLNAAFAMGLGAMWRTGPLATDPCVAEGLGLLKNERIVAFLYLGTPKVPLNPPPATEIENHVRAWP